MKEEYKNQDGRTIRTVHPSSVVQAIIFDEEQRATIKRLMSHVSWFCTSSQQRRQRTF